MLAFGLFPRVARGSHIRIEGIDQMKVLRISVRGGPDIYINTSRILYFEVEKIRACDPTPGTIVQTDFGREVTDETLTSILTRIEKL